MTAVNSQPVKVELVHVYGTQQASRVASDPLRQGATTVAVAVEASGTAWVTITWPPAA